MSSDINRVCLTMPYVRSRIDDAEEDAVSDIQHIQLSKQQQERYISAIHRAFAGFKAEMEERKLDLCGSKDDMTKFLNNLDQELDNLLENVGWQQMWDSTKIDAAHEQSNALEKRITSTSVDFSKIGMEHVAAAAVGSAAFVGMSEAIARVVEKPLAIDLAKQSQELAEKIASQKTLQLQRTKLRQQLNLQRAELRPQLRDHILNINQTETIPQKVQVQKMAAQEAASTQQINVTSKEIASLRQAIQKDTATLRVLRSGLGAWVRRGTAAILGGTAGVLMLVTEPTEAE